MPCNPKCATTATLSGHGGKRLMISQGGNSKFPEGALHPMCDECVEVMREEAELGILFNNDKNLIERYKKLKEGK